MSIRYGIVTPYTSYLVTEKAPLGVAEQEKLANETLSQYLAMPTAVAGQRAVQSAADAGAMQEASKAPEISTEASTTVQVVGSRTYVLSDGKWVDTAFDPDTMKTIQVDFLSSDYFSLVAADPELADAFALGEQVIALSQGKAYEVVANGSVVQPLHPTETETPYIVQEATSTPVATSEPTQNLPVDPPAAPSGLCGAGLLPLLLLPMALILIKRSK